MSNRIVTAIALAYAVGCGLQFDRFDPVAEQPDGSQGDGSIEAGDDAEPDVVSTVDAPADSPAEASTADASDAGESDGPACGGNRQPCCSGRMCQQGLMCRGSTCR